MPLSNALLFDANIIFIDSLPDWFSTLKYKHRVQNWMASYAIRNAKICIDDTVHLYFDPFYAFWLTAQVQWRILKAYMRCVHLFTAVEFITVVMKVGIYKFYLLLLIKFIFFLMEKVDIEF